MFPSPPVFPVEYKWFNPHKRVEEEVILDQPITHLPWLAHARASAVNGGVVVEESEYY